MFPCLFPCPALPYATCSPNIPTDHHKHHKSTPTAPPHLYLQVYLGTPKLLLILACIHVASWVAIALLLMACSAPCDLAIRTFGEALLEAITILSTIGFVRLIYFPPSR